MPKFAAFASGKTPTNSSHEIFSNSFVGSHYSHLVYSFVGSYKNNKLFPLSTVFLALCMIRTAVNLD